MKTAITAIFGACLIAVSALGQSTPALRGLQQEVAVASSRLDLPDAPSALMAEPVTANSSINAQTEILASDPYTPLTRSEKWKHFLRRTYASATFVGGAEDAVYTKATGGFMYCCGVGSWGQQYGASLADTEARSVFGDFLFPVLLKQDPRYFPKRGGRVLGRVWYAATRVLVTRGDNGKNTFNFSEILGVAFARALSNAYYPDRQRGMWETANHIAGSFQGDATSNLLTEFQPELQRLIHRCTPRRLRSMENRLPVSSPSSQY